MEFNGDLLGRRRVLVENKSRIKIIKFAFNIYELVRIYGERGAKLKFIHGNGVTFTL